MKTPLFVFLLLSSALPLAAQTTANAPVPRPAAPDLVTLSGQTYHAARVGRVEPDGITYFFSGGVVKIPFTDLPESIRKQYGYDPQKADAFAAADQQAQERNFEANQAHIAAQANAEQAEREKAGRNAMAGAGSGVGGQVGPLKHEVVPALDDSGGPTKLVELTVDQISTSPFSLKNVLVSMTGIERVDAKETSAGVYTMRFWGVHLSGCVEATLPKVRAEQALKGHSIFVAVTGPSDTPVKVSVLGNKTSYEGLHPVPTIYWDGDPSPGGALSN